jgi:hypothetical protein
MMIKSGKPQIKSINDEYKDGDLVLIKDGGEYHVGAYNGEYMQIVREDVQIPKSEIELELDRIRIEKEKKIEELRANELTTKTDGDIQLESQMKKREKYFPLFLKEFSLSSSEYTMEKLFAEEVEAIGMLDIFITNMERENEPEPEYDDGGDGAY